MLPVVRCLLLALLLGQVALVSAQDKAAELEAVRKRIDQALVSVRPDFHVAAVRPSVIPGLYEVHMGDGMLLYATADGQHVIEGDIYRVEPGNFLSLSEQARAHIRLQKLAAIPLPDMIVFSPKPPQRARAVVHVFTDVDCGFCQRLHAEVPQLNAQGIEVRYLAWPRAEPGSESYQRMVTAWCAKDRAATLTALKGRQPVPMQICNRHPLVEQFRLGQSFGVRGTPALVFGNGVMHPGYLPADQLAALALENAAP